MPRGSTPGDTTSTALGNTLPIWALGRHISAFVLTPLSWNTSTGVMSEVTGTVSGHAISQVGNIIGHLENVDIQQRVTLENMPDSDSVFENQVPVEIGTTYAFTEIEKGVGVNKLAALVNTCGFMYYKIALTRGQQTWTGYGVLSGYNMHSDRRGIKAAFTLAPVQMLGVTVNPAYATDTATTGPANWPYY